MESDESQHTTLFLDSFNQETMDEKVREQNENSAVISMQKNKKSYSDIVKKNQQVEKVVGEAKTAKNNEYRVEFPDMEGDIEMIPAPPPVTEENLRFSLRNAQNKMERVDEKARAAAKKRDIEGTPRVPNSFDTLSNPELILRAVKMGVNIPDADFTNVDIIRELEKCRNVETVKDKQTQPDVGGGHLVLTNAKGDQTPLNMNWEDNSDVDNDNFVVVRSRKKRERKINVVIARPCTRSQKGGASLQNVAGGSTLLPSRNTRQGGVKKKK